MRLQRNGRSLERELLLGPSKGEGHPRRLGRGGGRRGRHRRGNAFHHQGLVRRGVQVIAVDESERMLDELRRRIPVWCRTPSRKRRKDPDRRRGGRLCLRETCFSITSKNLRGQFARWRGF